MDLGLFHFEIGLDFAAYVIQEGNIYESNAYFFDVTIRFDLCIVS